MTMKPLFIYDGECAICERWAQTMQKRSTHAFDVLPYQQIPDIPKGLTCDALRQRAHLILAPDQWISGARAIVEVYAICNRPALRTWYLRSGLFAFLVERLYLFFASHRHLIPLFFSRDFD